MEFLQHIQTWPQAVVAIAAIIGTAFAVWCFFRFVMNA